MHQSAFDLMARELTALPFQSARVLDVGSLSVNGSLRPLVEGLGWTYVGLDVRAGVNVDVVAEDPYRFPFEDGAFDLVLTACALHNVERIWLLFPEMARVLKPGGALVAHTVCQWGENRHPKDYWRIQTDGLVALLELPGTLENIRVEQHDNRDLIGVAWKQ
jgi:SAM-dependent methyltransferase